MEKQPAGDKENRASLWIADNDKPIVDYGPRRQQIDEYLKEYGDKPMSERPEIKLGYYPPDVNGKRRAFVGKIATYTPDRTMAMTGLGPHLSKLPTAPMPGRGTLLIQTNLEMETAGGLRGEARHSIGEQAIMMALHYNSDGGRSFSGNVNEDTKVVALLNQPAEVPDTYRSDGEGGFIPVVPADSDNPDSDMSKFTDKVASVSNNVLAA